MCEAGCALPVATVTASLGITREGPDQRPVACLPKHEAIYEQNSIHPPMIGAVAIGHRAETRVLTALSSQSR